MSASASPETQRPDAVTAETDPETQGGTPSIRRPVVPGLVVLGAEGAEACSDGSCW
ncbi:hypothetical protein [Planotetraspora kaengkrachanensis]|uniref:Uncharacterized protein n=1 Tax=Planotetraspora kaengkrachanensis TaxID=575193 RepID=A0A8J3Q198_9ACTN|nr:hypothetical protein [Planotetraspora kaengkrachanensis]GIG84885.1 hypothetical protein Pka01_80120 [Planotetraspora kaengkrachanensis]